MIYGFIGLGNMAGAILKGMHASGLFSADTLAGYDVDAAQAQALAESVGLTPLLSEQEAAAKADVLVLAVKPQQAEQVLGLIRGQQKPGALLITILAGKPLPYYQTRLDEKAAVVRALPNLNALAGHSTTALCGNAHVSDRQMGQAKAMFAAVGTVSVIPESQARAFSALTGAGPAFVYQFIDALATAGVKAGFPRDTAQAMAADMVMGSAALVRGLGQHPAQLIDRVCSPGGTTIEGMHALKALGFEHAVHAAVDAVMEKDKKLSE